MRMVAVSIYLASYLAYYDQRWISGIDINETKILAAANQFVSLGLKAVGYEYINIDVCIFF